MVVQVRKGGEIMTCTVLKFLYIMATTLQSSSTIIGHFQSHDGCYGLSY